MAKRPSITARRVEGLVLILNEVASLFPAADEERPHLTLGIDPAWSAAQRECARAAMSWIVRAHNWKCCDAASVTRRPSLTRKCIKGLILLADSQGQVLDFDKCGASGDLTGAERKRQAADARRYIEELKEWSDAHEEARSRRPAEEAGRPKQPVPEAIRRWREECKQDPFSAGDG